MKDDNKDPVLLSHDTFINQVCRNFLTLESLWTWSQKIAHTLLGPTITSQTWCQSLQSTHSKLQEKALSLFQRLIWISYLKGNPEGLECKRKDRREKSTRFNERSNWQQLTRSHTKHRNQFCWGRPWNKAVRCWRTFLMCYEKQNGANEARFQQKKRIASYFKLFQSTENFQISQLMFHRVALYERRQHKTAANSIFRRIDLSPWGLILFTDACWVLHNHKYL